MSDNFIVKPIDVTAEKLEAIGKMNINDVAVDENSDNSSFPTSKVVNEAIKGGTANLLPLDVETEWIFDGGTAETEIEPKFVIDNEPSTTSPNAVKNNAITKYVNSKVKIVSDKTNELEEKIAPAIESEEYAGCYYRTVNGETEWLNPPMIANTEYRTTERHIGNVLYTKIVNFYNADTVEGNCGLSNVVVVRFHARTSNFVLPRTVSENTQNIEVGADGQYIYKQVSGLARQMVHLQVWYYKKAVL